MVEMGLKYVSEGQQPHNSEADAQFLEAGVTLIPDVLANAGGVTGVIHGDEQGSFHVDSDRKAFEAVRRICFCMGAGDGSLR